jgi:hypothetical protein
MRMPALLLAALVVTPVLVPAAARADIECGCSTTGAFVSPAESVVPSLDGANQSPHQKYRVALQLSYPGYYLQVYRIGAAQPVLSTFVGLDPAWGFSPDDDRFMVHWRVTAGTNDFEVQVFDLTSPQSGLGNAVISHIVNSGSVFFGFSPQGNWVVESWLQPPSPNEMQLRILSATTGVTAYSTGASFQQAPGSPQAEEIGVAGFGFSPDAGERTVAFVYTDITSIVQLRLVNLLRGSAVASLAPNASWSSSSYWQFSACGDAFAVGSLPFGTATHVDLYRTRDGSRPSPGQAEAAGVWSIAMHSTASSFVATMNGTNFTLGANTAGDACPSIPAIQSLALDPGTIVTGGSSTATVTFAAPSPLDFMLQVGVSDPWLVSVGSSAAVQAGQASMTFPLHAASAATVGPVSVTVTVQGPGGTPVSQVLTVNPSPRQLASFEMAPDVPVLGGTTASFGVILDYPALAGGALVSFTNPRPDLVTVPETLLITEGNQASGIDVLTTPVAVLDSVTIVATLNSSSIPFTLRVRPPELVSLDALQTCVSPPDQVLLRARLDGAAPAGGIVLHLSSDDPAATVPGTVKIPAGQTQLDVTADATAVSETHWVDVTGWTQSVVDTASFTLLSSSVHLRVRMLDMVDGYGPGGTDTGNEVAGINGRGDLVGTQDGYTQLSYSEGAVWLDGAPQLCDGRAPHGFWDFVTGAGINNHRRSVGGGDMGPWEADSTGRLSWLYDPGTGNNLTGQATCINDAGDIGGGYDFNSWSDPHAWLLLATDTLITIPLEADSHGAWITAINAQGLACGIEELASRDHIPFSWDVAHGKQLLALPNGSATGEASCVDDNGWISGWVAPDGRGASTYPASWKDGQLVRVESTVGAFDRTSPKGLLSAGWQLFGTTQSFTLPDLTDCDIANAYVWGLNDAGQMAVSGDTRVCGHLGCRTVSRAFLVSSLPGAPWLDASVPVLDAAAAIEDLEATRVRLRWAVSGLPPATATVQRWTESGGWTSLGTPAAERDAYTFTDSTVTAATRYAYRLAVLQGGQLLHVGFVEVTTPRGADLAMLGFFPNPSRDGAPRVAFVLPVAGEATLELLDIGGRRVAEHRFDRLEAGAHQWDVSRDARLAPGVYVSRVTQGGRSMSRRVTLLR